MSIKKKGAFLFLGFFFLGLFNFVSSMYFLNLQKRDAVLVNNAGRQRALSQKMTKNVLYIVNGDTSDKTRQDLEKDINLFDKTLLAFINGDTKEGLPRATDDALLKALVTLRDGKWNQFKNTIIEIKNTGKSTPTKLVELQNNNMEVFNQADQITKIYEKLAEKKVNYLKYFQMSIILLNMVLMVVAWYVLKRISDSIDMVVTVAQKVGVGDLSAEKINVKTKDETFILAETFNQMVDKLKNMVYQINSTSQSVAATSQELSVKAEETTKATQQVAQTVEQVAIGSSDQSTSAMNVVEIMDQVARAVEQIAAGAGEQSKNVYGTTEMVEHMVKRIDVMAGGMEEVRKAAEQNGVVAENGGKSVEQTVEGMLRVKDAVFETAQKIHELGDRSQKIGEIIQVIDDIAAQTNLLALNAAIEAARAGEHGKGFAVVADEVRRLADRSGKATKEIAELIIDIQKGTELAVESMQVGTREVEEGVVLAQAAGQSLGEIVEGVKTTGENVHKIMDIISEILKDSQEVSQAINSIAAVTEENSAATEEMSASATEVNNSMQNVAAISQENAAAAEEVSASSEELTAAIEEISASSDQLAGMALELQNLIEQFKV